MFCSSCGTDIHPQSKFCPHCGGSVPGAGAPPPVTYPPPGQGYSGPPMVAGTNLPPELVSHRSKLGILLLWRFLSPFGAHRFYLGHIGLAVGQLVVSLLTCGLGALWPFIDGIVLLAGEAVDAEGRYVVRWD